MKSHLNLKLNGTDVALPSDFSMNFHDENPIFSGNEMWSEPAQIPIDGNRKLLESIDQAHYGRRAREFDKMLADVEVEGIPVRHGWSRVQDGTLIDGALDVNIDASAQSFDDLIGDLECRDVPLKHRIKIGEKIGDVHVDVDYLYQVSVTYDPDSKKGDQTKTYLGISPAQASGDFEPQALGFSQPGVTSPWGQVNGITVGNRIRTYPDGNQVAVPRFDVNYINVSEPYGSTVNSPHKDNTLPGNTIGWPYCNARVAYTHYKKDDTTVPPSTSDAVDLNTNDQNYESMNPYWVLDAQRPQSGICFYVLYFLDCLFAHLGVTFDNSELYAVEDLRRLAFFTTHCKFDPVYEFGQSFSGYLDDITTVLQHGWLFDFRQEWQEHYTEEEYNKLVFRDVNGWLDDRGCGGNLWVFKPTTKTVQTFSYKDPDGKKTDIVVGQEEVAAIEFDARIKKIHYTARVMSMYANSDNFPDASVKDVIDSLEASFGIRFAYDYERRHVKAYLLRNIFRSTEPQVKLNGEILSVIPKVDLTSGVRMKYSSEGTDKEQRQNVKRGIRDYDTDYDYIEYPKNRTVTNLTFNEIRKKVSSNNNKVYIDQTTGNAYRVKVERETLGKPVLFEVGQFKGVEVGDCSDANKDNVVEYVSSFVPVPFNRVSAYLERVSMATHGKGDYLVVEGGYSIGEFNKDLKPTYAVFVDEQMEHEFITQRIDNVLDNRFIDVACSEVLNLVESYDPSQTDDGNSPLQSYDWGLAIAIMRGGGTNMTIQHYDYNYDFFGNSKWKTLAGNYALSSDSMTQEGEDYDYNGELDGDGGGERLSLKIRAYKQPEWSDVPLCNADEVDGTTITRRIRTRGLADTMMAEVIHFHLHKQPLQVTMRMTAAELADIPNHWDKRVQIGDMIGLIKDVQWSASVAEGVGNAVIEFYKI